MELYDIGRKIKKKYGDKVYVSVGGKEITNEDTVTGEEDESNLCTA